MAHDGSNGNRSGKREGGVESRLRRKAQIRRRKGKRETPKEEAARFKDLVITKTQERGVEVPAKLARELRNASRKRDGHLRLYKLDLRRCHLMDDHVEALTEALLELPVLRKLDLRGSKAITVRTLSALIHLLKAQVEMFKLVLQADARTTNLSTSFLYSVKLDATALQRDVNLAGEIEAHMAALQVADTMIDVRHAFLQADVHKTGTLSPIELAGAIRNVMGVTPKREETGRALRLWGERGPHEGEDPKLINLEGFEAAMVGRLRQDQTLALLSRSRDDLLFGPPNDETDDSNYVSPWSTRSFSATTGIIGGTFERKRRYPSCLLSPSRGNLRPYSNEVEPVVNPVICNRDGESKRSPDEGGRRGPEAVKDTMGEIILDGDDRAIDDHVVFDGCGGTEALEGAKIGDNHKEEMDACGTEGEGSSASCSKARIPGAIDFSMRLWSERGDIPEPGRTKSMSNCIHWKRNSSTAVFDAARSTTGEDKGAPSFKDTRGFGRGDGGGGSSSGLDQLPKGRSRSFGCLPSDKAHATNVAASMAYLSAESQPSRILEERMDYTFGTPSFNVEVHDKMRGASEAGSDPCKRDGWQGHSSVSHGQTSPSTQSLNHVDERKSCASECREPERESLLKLGDEGLVLTSTIDFERAKDKNLSTASRSSVSSKTNGVGLSVGEKKRRTFKNNCEHDGPERSPMAPNVAAPSSYDDGNLNVTENGGGGGQKRGSTFGSATCCPTISKVGIINPPQQEVSVANAVEGSKQRNMASEHKTDSTSVADTVPTMVLQPCSHPSGHSREEANARATAASPLPLGGFGDGPTVRMPHCLAPVNVLAAARPTACNCEKRKLLAARIHRSVESNATSATEEASSQGAHALVSSSCVNVSLRVSIAPKHPDSGSTASYNEADLNRGAGGEPVGARSFSKKSDNRWRRISDQGVDMDEAGANTEGHPSLTNDASPDEEKVLAVHFDEQSLEMSRNALTEMGVVLELEATHGISLDALNGLHTLVLSNNQLQELDFTVLTAMPALRHLDVGNNLLHHMEPEEGLDLPPRLETLVMSHNCISRIGGIGCCCALRAIDLSYNRIEHVLGLEHLSLLEQLDLSHNLIPETACARALSFNLSLKLLRLEGNPVAKHLRYRAALACLLPHVRAIDNWGMLRRSTGSNEGGGGESHGRYALARAESRGGRRENGVFSVGVPGSVTRAWQAEQDERRSREWYHVLKWREEQALREEAKERQTSDGGGKAHQAVDAAHQRRLMEELARPRSQICTSEVTFSKAKTVASHRPGIYFGVSHRRDGPGHDALFSTRINKTMPTKPTEANAKEVRQEEPQYLDAKSATLSGLSDPQGGGGGGGGARRGCTGEMNERVSSMGTQRIRSISGGGDGDHSGERGKNVKSRAAQRSEDFSSCESWIGDQTEIDDISFTVSNEDLNNAVATADNGKSCHDVVDCSSSHSRTPHHLSEMVNDSSVEQSNIASALPVSVASPAPRDFVFTRLSADGEGLPELTADSTIRRRSEEAHLVAGTGEAEVETHVENLAGPIGSSTTLENELREGWLRDVRLETEVAGLALQVLLKMCKKRRNRTRQEQQRLARLRVALDNMDLLSDSHGPAPTIAGSEGARLEETIAATRQVTATKAAVRKMLRLLEEADSDKGGGGDKEGLDQYAEFIQQQPEIVAVTGGSSDKNYDDRAFIHRYSHQGKSFKTASVGEDSGLFAAVAAPKTPAHTRLPSGSFIAPSSSSSVATLISLNSGIPSSDERGGDGGDGETIAGVSAMARDFEKAPNGADIGSEAVGIEPLSVPARATREGSGGGKVRENTLKVRNACGSSVVGTTVASTGMMPSVTATETATDDKVTRALQDNATVVTQRSIVADDVAVGDNRGTGGDDRTQSDFPYPQVRTTEDVGDDCEADMAVIKPAEGKAPDSVLPPEGTQHDDSARAAGALLRNDHASSTKAKAVSSTSESSSAAHLSAQKRLLQYAGPATMLPATGSDASNEDTENAVDESKPTKQTKRTTQQKNGQGDGGGVAGGNATGGVVVSAAVSRNKRLAVVRVSATDVVVGDTRASRELGQPEVKTGVITVREGGEPLDETDVESRDKRVNDEGEDGNLGGVTAPNIDNQVLLSEEVVNQYKDDNAPVSAGEELHPGAGVSSRIAEHVVGSLAREGGTKGEKCAMTNQTGSRELTTELAWIEGYDPTHDCYYYHHVPTGESTWYKPDEPWEPYVHSDEHDGDHVLPPRSKDGRISESRARSEAGVDERRVRRRSRNEKSATASPRRKDNKDRDESHGRRCKRGEERRTGTTSKKGPSSIDRKMPTRRTSSRKSCVSSSSSISLSDPTDKDRSRGRDAREGRGRGREAQSTLSASRSGASAVTDRDRDRSRQSRRRRVKTALERLNDLTDENIDMSGCFSTSSEERRMHG